MMGSSQHSLLEQLLNEETEQEELHACTDITGFGLLGHLGEMLDDYCRLQLDAWKIPSLNGALELLEAGHCSSLAPANRSAWHWLDAPGGNADPRIHLNLEGLQVGVSPSGRAGAAGGSADLRSTADRLLRNAGHSAGIPASLASDRLRAVTQVCLAEQRRTLALASSADLSSQR